MHVKIKDFLPIVFLGGFNILTLIFYLISPFNYLYGNYIGSISYILLNIFFLFFGYFFSIIFANKLKYRSIYVYNFNGELKLFKVLLIFFTITFSFRYGYWLKYNFYDFLGMFNEIFIGILDPKLGYISMSDTNKVSNIPWSLYALFTIFHTLFFLTGAILWKKLPLNYKIFYGFFVFIEAIFWYSRGTNFGIITLLVIFFLAYFLNIKKINLKFVSNVFLLFLIAIIIFSFIMSIRMEGVSSYDLSSYEIYLTTINYNSAILKFTPDFLHPIILSFFSYITQGYYFLSFGFDMGFRFTYFLGSNGSLIGISNIINFPIENNTYVYRLLATYGIDPNVQWHSAYLWLASDFSFYLVPLYIFLLGFLLGISWVISINYNDYLFKILFIIVGGYILFLFSNTNFISSFLYLFIFILILIFIKFFNLSKSN